MRLGRFGERVASAYVGAHLSRAHYVEESGHTLGRIFRGGVVMPDGRPGEEDRSFLGEYQRRDRLHRSGGIAEAHHHASGPERIERTMKGRRAHPVVCDIDPAALRDLLHTSRHILVAVEDRVLTPVPLGELGLFLRADVAWPRGSPPGGPPDRAADPKLLRGMRSPRVAVAAPQKKRRRVGDSNMAHTSVLLVMRLRGAQRGTANREILSRRGTSRGKHLKASRATA